MRHARSLLLGGLVVATATCFYGSWREGQSLRRTLALAPVVATARAQPLPHASRVSAHRQAFADGELLSTLEFPDEGEPAMTPVAPPRRSTVRPRKVARVEAPVAREELNIADLARRAIRSKQAVLQLCYEQELKKQAAFNGFVVVTLSVAASGRVEAAGVSEATRRDAKVASCIVAHLKQLKLPALGEDVELELPIRLQAQALAAR